MTPGNRAQMKAAGLLIDSDDDSEEDDEEFVADLPSFGTNTGRSGTRMGGV